MSGHATGALQVTGVPAPDALRGALFVPALRPPSSKHSASPVKLDGSRFQASFIR